MSHTSTPQDAVACFNGGCNCAQSVFCTYCEDFGLDKETAQKLSCGFGAGMGRMGNTCGAVSVAYMLIGLKYGAAKEKAYAMVCELAKRFEARCGSTVCRELLGVSFGDDSEKVTQRVKDVCHVAVRIAAELVEDLLYEL